MPLLFQTDDRDCITERPIASLVWVLNVPHTAAVVSVNTDPRYTNDSTCSKYSPLRRLSLPLGWTAIKIRSEVRRRFRVKPRSTLEPRWCNANYGWTRIKVKFDLRSKLSWTTLVQRGLGHLYTDLILPVCLQLWFVYIYYTVMPVLHFVVIKRQSINQSINQSISLTKDFAKRGKNIDNGLLVSRKWSFTARLLYSVGASFDSTLYCMRLQ